MPRVPDGPSYINYHLTPATLMDMDTMSISISTSLLLSSPPHQIGTFYMPNIPLAQMTSQLSSKNPKNMWADLLQEAHATIRQLTDDKVMLLDKLNKWDLEVNTQGNIIKHLWWDLCGADAQIMSLEQHLREVPENTSADECPQKIPHNHLTHQPIASESPGGAPLPLLISPNATSSGPRSREIIPYVKPPSLQLDDYSWYSLPDHKCFWSSKVWWNVPVPGQFFPNDFTQGLTVTGWTWSNVTEDVRHQWCFKHCVKHFINSPKGFKFLVNMKYISKEYAKGSLWVNPEALTWFQTWYNINTSPQDQWGHSPMSIKLWQIQHYQTVSMLEAYNTS